MNTGKKCKCGFTVGDPMIIPKTKYNKKGYFWLSMGYSAKPTEVVFQCQTCGEIIATSTDEEIIEKYRYNSDIIQ
ncbi:MAG TPA: hypothetical protein PK605_06570 [Ignavibacteria bacterium]|nr:hypothetical protein [Ignavibacteria bacterium]HAX47700.1 hypothetical protein [Bacteroidota bacterium]HRE10343.1 hypothetical protein [Ignavibacteria bacterium]HRF67038.1 hypothetical protein [Ignavibacteria bacterium]HRJ04048.1 hypothetical protein [Ignavibacteria bacterium]